MASPLYHFKLLFFCAAFFLFTEEKKAANRKKSRSYGAVFWTP